MQERLDLASLEGCWKVLLVSVAGAEGKHLWAVEVRAEVAEVLLIELVGSVEQAGSGGWVERAVWADLAVQAEWADLAELAGWANLGESAASAS